MNLPVRGCLLSELERAKRCALVKQFPKARVALSWAEVMGATKEDLDEVRAIMPS
jgi:hypothetical protein